MDGAHRMDMQDMEPGADALADYVRRYAPAARYKLSEWGESARLARDSEMDSGTLTRLMKGERVPRARQLWKLSLALGRPYAEVLAVAGTIPPEAAAQLPAIPVASPVITADALADQLGITSAAGRAYVGETLNRLRKVADLEEDPPGHGSSAANG